MGEIKKFAFVKIQEDNDKCNNCVFYDNNKGSCDRASDSFFMSSFAGDEFLCYDSEKHINYIWMLADTEE
jgi:hypothetical protein